MKRCRQKSYDKADSKYRERQRNLSAVGPDSASQQGRPIDLFLLHGGEVFHTN